jgi:hypothetical protein
MVPSGRTSVADIEEQFTAQRIGDYALVDERLTERIRGALYRIGRFKSPRSVFPAAFA